MQHQIANAVGLFVGPPPDLLVTEFLQAVFDLRQEVFRQMVARTRDESLADVAHQLSSAESIVSGRCLCLALRPAGRAFSSGLAWVRGCPGGASGRRIELMIDAFRLRRFDREDFIAFGRGRLARC